jgi:hypothetical protein
MTEGIFSAKLQDGTNLNVLGDDLEGGVKEYTQPAPVSLRLRSEDQGEQRS